MGRCECGNNDIVKFRRYSDPQDRDSLIGVCCTTCGIEWLDEEFVPPDVTETLRFGPHIFKKKETRQNFRDPEFQAPTDRTQIVNLDYLEDYLKPGDHIAWKRPYIIWHHAIVEKVKGRYIYVIHNSGSSDGIKREKLDSTKQNGILFRVDYPEEVSKNNPKRLVLARAISMIGERKYRIFDNNCEGFTHFCIVGGSVSESQQKFWFFRKIKSILGNALGKVTLETIFENVAKIGLPEMAERILKRNNLFGAGLVVVIEGVCLCISLSKISKARKRGEIGISDYVASSVEKVFEACGTAGGMIGLSVLGQAAGGALGTLLLPGIGTTIGMFIGALVGGVAGGILGKAFGIVLGRVAGDAIAGAFALGDDELVEDIAEINVGDQLVLYGNFLHPRCHVLVTDIVDNDIAVIRNSNRKGVIEETLSFSSCYRVKWDRKRCVSAEISVRRARRKIGTRDYDLLTNNCKHFVQWCKST